MYNGRKSASIKGFWGILSFYCGQNTSETGKCGEKLEITNVNNKLFFHCPRCGFDVPYPLVDAYVCRLMDIIVSETEHGFEINLTNYKSKSVDSVYGITYHFVVTKHTQSDIRIEIYK